MKGLTVNIYKSNNSDSSNGGISSQYTEVLLLDENLDGYLDESDAERLSLPIVKLQNNGGYLSAVPVDQPEGDGAAIGPMFGGCFIWSSDSRMRRLSQQPIPLHDRFESAELYDMLSR